MIHTGTSIYLPNGTVINLIGMTEDKIEKAFQELVYSLNDINRFNLYQFFKENNKQLINDTSIVWNLKGKPNSKDE